MIMNFEEKYFINPAFEFGIRSYILHQKGESFPKIYTFEMNVIKTLTIIFGEKSILLPYKIDNPKAFECNLLMYDIKEKDLANFINYMNDYYNFLNDYKSEKKATGLINEIETILIKMILKRAEKKEYSSEEITEFDKIFNPINGDLKKLKELVSKDNGLIKKYWEENKVVLSNTQIQMIAVNPELLSSDEYKKYGYDIRTIATLSNDAIKNINKSIKIEQNREYQEYDRKTKRRRPHIILTSGSGFVDKLLLLSIIATELMVGFVTFIIFGG